MKKLNPINSLADLQSEKLRLKKLSGEQEAYLSEQYQLLSQKIEAPLQFVKSLTSWIPGGEVVKTMFQNNKGNSSDDWLTKGLKIGSTFILNRFFLKKAGLIKRLIVTFLSQQALGQVNKSTIQSIVTNITNLIRAPHKKKSPLSAPDERIPEYSETS